MKNKLQHCRKNSKIKHQNRRKRGLGTDTSITYDSDKLVIWRHTSSLRKNVFVLFQQRNLLYISNTTKTLQFNIRVA
jgi:hypothetical protein